jgi:hypothetical protein
MSIETDLSRIAAALEAIAANLKPVTPAVPVVETVTVTSSNPVPAPVAVTLSAAVPAPVVAAPVPVPPAPVMPAPVAAGSAPFSEHKGMLAYVMSSYQALGAEKGAGIQKVLESFGVKNINEVKAEHYATLYAGIEALK